MNRAMKPGGWRAEASALRWPGLSSRRRGVVLSGLALMLVMPTSPRAAALPVETLTIETSRGPIALTVEIARTEAERAQGLMFRRELPPLHGMLFDFGTPQPASFWMRNTFISLDLLFVDVAGRIVRIKARAQPHDETPIPSGAPILGVVEIAGGEAARLGIAPGDHVRHAIFG